MDKTSIVVNKCDVSGITGNRSNFIREAIKEKLERDELTMVDSDDLITLELKKANAVSSREDLEYTYEVEKKNLKVRNETLTSNYKVELKKLKMEKDRLKSIHDIKLNNVQKEIKDIANRINTIKLQEQLDGL